MFNWTLIYLIRLKCAGFFDKSRHRLPLFLLMHFEYCISGIYNTLYN